MNGVSEDERFADSEEVEGGGITVEVPVESVCCAEAIDDVRGSEWIDGEHGLENGLGNFIAVGDGVVIDDEVGDLSGDGV